MVALLHDIGDALAPTNHSEVAAAVLRPFISEDRYWIVKHHGIFQGRYYFHHLGMDPKERDKYRGHKLYQATVDFCEHYDQVSFDPNYDSKPLEFFEPTVQRLFAQEPLPSLEPIRTSPAHTLHSGTVMVAPFHMTVALLRHSKAVPRSEQRSSRPKTSYNRKRFQNRTSIRIRELRSRRKPLS